ncbi:transglutaminase-like domain-containing protein, partial [Kribbia dieselivorans]|uniref:transglutaminase-like domain-containing protein n=1 Tax=Kribbia dieselivorans TaxID=331526 RepID=UPI0008387317
TARQLVLAHPLAVDPSGFALTYDDYWGTRVTELEVREAHTRFTTSLLSDVNVTAGPFRRLAADFTHLDAPSVADSFCEFLLPGDPTPVTAADHQRATAARAAAGTPTHLVETLSGTLANAAAGEAATDEVTHRVIAALRSVGVPARFVSGYRAPDDAEPGSPTPAVITSWLDYWDGAWHGWDPSLGQPVGLRHVIIGWGRDRSDCPTLRAIYSGDAQAECHTEVVVTRLA